MSITITSLRVDEKVTPASVPVWYNDVPFLIVNITFKIDKNEEDSLWSMAKGESESYIKTLTIDDPEEFTKWVCENDIFYDHQYPGFGREWIPNDPPWVYIEKFDTFQVREYIADCPVTRAILEDLKFYKEHGKLPTIYRHMDDCIVLNHLRTLGKYWD